MPTVEARWGEVTPLAEAFGVSEITGGRPGESGVAGDGEVVSVAMASDATPSPSSPPW